jgi:beta-xylosidase
MTQHRSPNWDNRYFVGSIGGANWSVAVGPSYMAALFLNQLNQFHLLGFGFREGAD